MSALGRLPLALLATSALITAAGPAAANTVAITEVSGPIRDDIAATIADAMRDRGVTVVTLSDWERAALEGGLDPVQDRVSVGRRVGATRLLRAEVARSGQRWILTVEVMDRRGRPLKRWRARSKKVRRLEYLVKKKMMSRIQGVVSGAPGARKKTAAPDSRTSDARLSGTVRLGLLNVKGGKRTRRRLSRALRAYPNIRLVPVEQVERAAADLGANLDTTDGRMEVARALRLQAWLSVRSRGRRQRYASSGQVFSGHDGERVDTVEGRGKNERAAIEGMLALIVDPLSRTQAPAPDAGARASVRRAPPPPRRATRSRRRTPPPSRRRSARADAKTEARFEREPEPAGQRNRAALSVGLGVSLQTRDFSYNDDTFQALRPYELSGAPAISGELRWFPAAHFVDGLFRHIGVDFRGRYLVGVSSEDAEGNQFDTTSFDLSGGLRGRFPLGSHEIGLGLGFGQHQFSVDVPEGGPEVPTVGYTYLRVGVDGRVSLPADLHLYVGGAWRQIFSAGDLDGDEWFPRASSGGFDAQLGLGWVFLSGFEARLGAEYTRYFFSLNPEPGDARVAGGALDQYISGTIDVLWTWDG